MEGQNKEGPSSLGKPYPAANLRDSTEYPHTRRRISTWLPSKPRGYIVDPVIERFPRGLLQPPKATRVVHRDRNPGRGPYVPYRLYMVGYRENREFDWAAAPGPIKERRTIGRDAPSVGAAERSIGGLICLRILRCQKLRQNSRFSANLKK